MIVQNLICRKVHSANRVPEEGIRKYDGGAAERCGAHEESSVNQFC